MVTACRPETDDKDVRKQILQSRGMWSRLTCARSLSCTGRAALRQGIDDQANVLALCLLNHLQTLTSDRRIQDRATLNRHCQIKPVDRGIVQKRRLGSQALGGEPGRIARRGYVKVDQRGFAAQADLFQITDRGRNCGNLRCHRAYQTRQHRVDLVKVRLELRQLIRRTDLRGGNAKIEIDVCIHSPTAIAAGSEGRDCCSPGKPASSCESRCRPPET